MLIVSKLENIMESNQITLDQLSELTGLSRMTIYNAKRGRMIALPTAMMISKVLDIPLTEIWYEDSADPEKDEEEAA